MLKKLSLLFLLLIGFFGHAQNVALFDEATKAYNDGEYEKAIDAYLEILENNRHSAALYFNLGNAYYKLNQIPESIYYYEKSLLLNPDDQEVMTNLSYAQNMTLDAIDTLPQTGLSRLYKNITSKFTFDQWAYASIICMLLFVLLYIAFYYNQYSVKKRVAFIGSVMALFLCVLCIVFASIEFASFQDDNPAIIFADEVNVRSEPNLSSENIFTLHSGTKVNVLDSLNNYLKIRLADGKTGWLNENDLKILKDF